jgi:hypothetical protein
VRGGRRLFVAAKRHHCRTLPSSLVAGGSAMISQSTTPTDRASAGDDRQTSSEAIVPRKDAPHKYIEMEEPRFFLAVIEMEPC